MTHAAFLAALLLQTAAEWEPTLDGARAKAAEERLPLLVLFANDEKADKAMFDSQFDRPELKGWRDKFVVTLVIWNREDPWHQELGIVGTPTMVILNPLEPDAKKQVMNVVGEQKAKDFPQTLKNAYGKIHGSFFARMSTKLTDAKRGGRGGQRRVILLAIYDDSEASKAWHTARDEVMAMNDKTLLDAAQKTNCVEIDAKTIETLPEEEKTALEPYKATKLPTIFFIEPAKGDVVLKLEAKLTKATLKAAIIEAVKKANLDAVQQPPANGKYGPGMKPPGGKFPKKP